MKDCDHAEPCACVKHRREPISDETIERLLSVEREDPDFDPYAGMYIEEDEAPR